jgi:methylated-DNA-protein-cysteine methyltransferase related protein
MPRRGLIHAASIPVRGVSVPGRSPVAAGWHEADGCYPPAMRLPAGWSIFYRVVRRVPRGRVATYGQIALLAGRPGAARQVGYALAALRGAEHRIPWQRVLAARPRCRAAVSILDPMGAAVQRALLESEGVRFDVRGWVELAEFGWARALRAGAAAVTERRPVRVRGPGRSGGPALPVGRGRARSATRS